MLLKLEKAKRIPVMLNSDSDVVDVFLCLLKPCLVFILLQFFVERELLQYTVWPLDGCREGVVLNERILLKKKNKCLPLVIKTENYIGKNSR